MDKGVGSHMCEFLTMKKASDLKPYCLSSGDSSLSSDRRGSLPPSSLF